MLNLLFNLHSLPGLLLLLLKRIIVKPLSHIISLTLVDVTILEDLCSRSLAHQVRLEGTLRVLLLFFHLDLLQLLPLELLVSLYHTQLMHALRVLQDLLRRLEKLGREADALLLLNGLSQLTLLFLSLLSILVKSVKWVKRLVGSAGTQVVLLDLGWRAYYALILHSLREVITALTVVLLLWSTRVQLMLVLLILLEISDLREVTTEILTTSTDYTLLLDLRLVGSSATGSASLRHLPVQILLINDCLSLLLQSLFFLKMDFVESFK